MITSGSQSGRYRPQGSIGPSKGSINSHKVEWGSLIGQGVNEKQLGSTGDMKAPVQNYC